MKAIIEIILDEQWNGYENIQPELFMEDLFGKFTNLKDGIEDVKLIKIEN